MFNLITPHGCKLIPRAVSCAWVRECSSKKRKILLVLPNLPILINFKKQKRKKPGFLKSITPMSRAPFKRISSKKVAPADLKATADAEKYRRNNFFEKRGKDIYAGGCDIRKPITYTHMREASKKGCFEWFVLCLPAPLIVTNKPLDHALGTRSSIFTLFWALAGPHCWCW